MLNVFVKKSAEELHIQLSDGRMMPLEDLVRDYERLLNEEALKKVATSELEETLKKVVTSEPKEALKKVVTSEPKEALKKVATSDPKDDKSTVSKLKVGEWFRIDREVIDKSKEEIRRKCNEAGTEGEKYWKRFEKSNKIADKNPDQYPRLIETYIFEHNWDHKTEQEMRDMCENVGDGMCCEVICDLELQMRICNGEPVDDLFKKADKLPYVRVIKFRDGGTGYFGGGVDCYNIDPPADFFRLDFNPSRLDYNDTPYAFRRVLL